MRMFSSNIDKYSLLYVLTMCLWVSRFQMGRWRKLSESFIRLYRMCPGPRWATDMFQQQLITICFFRKSPWKKVFSSRSFPGVHVCTWIYICIFANGYCVYGVHVSSGCVHGRSAVVPRAHTGVCWCDDRERTPTETAYRRTGHTPGGVNTHCVCTSLYISQKWTWCVSVFSQ